MCGIAGYVNFDGNSVSYNNLKKMTDAIFHRGPDGEGHWYESNVGLGHRRLAIIDLSDRAQQPMTSFTNRYIITYNGEVYNFRDIRSVLEKKGYKFFSNSDTEVVLNAWVEWGKDSVTKFNGMFAFAIFDKLKNNIYLVRDRYGIKPLYYAHFGSTFLFASEQKAILENNKIKKELDHKALLEYFTFQNIFTDRTFLKNIKILNPATIMKINVVSGKMTSNIYWDYSFIGNKFIKKKEEYNEELKYLIKQAVQRQLISDVELGSYLSGGMDSGTITAITSEKFNNLKTFTCGFDLSSASGVELAFDERIKAESMSAYFKTEHYETILKAGDMEKSIPHLVHHLEEPRVGQSYPNLYIAKLASKFVKVILSGVGGDELFGGYPWRYFRTSYCKNFEDYIDQYYLFWQRLISNKDIKTTFSPIWDKVNDVWTRDVFRNVFKDRHKNSTRLEDFINNSLYFECKTFLHGLFIIEDKISMSQSLETRVPFMDNDLVNFAMSCPVKLKINKLNEIIQLNENGFYNKRDEYFKKTNDGKQILRQAMSEYIPLNIINAPKQGFSSPDASWFKGPSIDFVREKLNDDNSEIYNYLNKDILRTLINQHLEGCSNKRLLIWSFLYVNEWIRQNLFLKSHKVN